MFRFATALLLLELIVSVAAPATAADRGLGLVVQNNIAAMAVDLNPAYAKVKIEGTEGQLGDAAVTRYRAGRVKPLLPLSGTSNLGQNIGGMGATTPGAAPAAAAAGAPR